MPRTTGPVGPTNLKTYAAESLLTRGYVATTGAAVGNCTAVTAAGQVSLGIVAEDVLAVGHPASIVRFGDAPAIAGGVVAVGAPVKPNAAGKLVAASTGDATIGRAECAATGDGDEFLVFVFPGKM